MGVFTVGSDRAGHFDYLNDYCKVVYLDRTKNITSTILRERNQHIQRIGIIGTGRIAERFVPESKLVSGINTESVYNPHEESATRFAQKWSINVYSDLEVFYAGIDMVYIASPHETHYEYIKSALGHGKHVLCEKLLTLHGVQAKELYQCAKDNELVLLEGIKAAYCPGFNKLLGIACSGTISNTRNVEACFKKSENKESRELTDLRYGGSFTEREVMQCFLYPSCLESNMKECRLI